MDSISLTFIFILGTLVGSFINVISLRYNTGFPIAVGRSTCLHCNTTLAWYDLVPIFSFLFLLGRCRHCKSRLSFQYPIIEIVTGFLFVALAVRQFYYWPLYSAFTHGILYSILFFVYYAFVWSLLLIIILYDIRHKIIPDGLVFTFITLSVLKLLLFLYYKGFTLDRIDLLHLLSPLMLSLPFVLLWYFSEGKWMGLGDGKLMFGIGAFLGFTLGVSAITIAFWIGALWGIVFILKSKFFPESGGMTLKSEIPFAPFLVAATLFVFLSHIDVFGISQMLSV